MFWFFWRVLQYHQPTFEALRWYLTGTPPPHTQKKRVFCEILVDIPNSIWTSFALFTSIYLAVFGHVLHLLHLSKILNWFFRDISAPPLLLKLVFYEFSSLYPAVFGNVLPFFVNILSSFWTLLHFWHLSKMLKLVFSWYLPPSPPPFTTLQDAKIDFFVISPPQKK